MKLEKLTAKGFEYIYRDKKTGIFYFRRFTNATGEIKRSLKTKEPAEAKRHRDQLLSDGKLAKPRPKQRETALELFDKWLIRKESLNRADGTLANVRATRKHIEEYFVYMMPDEITAEWWETTFIPETRQRKYRGKIGEESLLPPKDRKLFNDRKWISAFTRQLFDDGVIQKIPKLINPDHRESIGKVYTDEDIADLLNFAQNEDLRLAILMASTMAMRKSEIFFLRPDRVDLKAKVIRLRREDTKTRRARGFSISEAVYPYLVKRCQPGAVWIFPSKDDKDRPLHKDGFKTAWTNLKSMCGITGRFHDLRHTWITKAIANGANPAHVAQYAGVTLQVIERVYLHLSEKDTSHLAEIVTYEE